MARNAGKQRRDHANTAAAVFSHFAQTIAMWTGHAAAFLLAVAAIVIWVVTGPIFDYSDTWQLVINTGTTIVTFLMVFLIQNTQNRDIMAVQLKLSELVLAMKGANDKFATIEDMNDEELEKLHQECTARAEITRRHIESRETGGAGKNGKRAAAHSAATPSRKSSRRRKPSA
jgi:low affinity Fe/Cu permease